MIYRYKAKNKAGRNVFGKVVALSEGEATAKLRRRELSPTSLRDVSSSFLVKAQIFIFPPRGKDLVVFSREFAVMISANVPIVESLLVMIDQTENLALQKMIAAIAFDVDSGALLSDALAKHSRFFSYFYVNMVRSGETSGKLDEVLNYLADESEKNYDMNRKFKGAMVYPIFIISGLVGVSILLMVFVIPQLTSILTETGMALPLSTRIVIGTSKFLQSYWLFVLAAVFAAVFGMKAYSRTKVGKKQLDILLLRLPIFGPLFNQIYLIRFTRSLSTLLKGGVTITKALEISSSIAGNYVYQELIQKTLAAINDGRPISSAFEASKQVPKMIPQMMSIGERTGKLDSVLDKVTDFYSREASNRLNNLSTLIEPIIMVVLGIGVAIMVSAVILPMYNMATQF